MINNIKIKSLLCLICTIIFVWPLMPANLCSAEEEKMDGSEEVATQENQHVTDALNYIYVDKNNLGQGEEQIIVVSIEDIQNRTAQPQNILLGYSLNGTEGTIAASEWMDNLVVFRTNVQECGTYQLTYCEVTGESGIERIQFSDMNLVTEFYVEEAIDASEELILNDGNPIALSGEGLEEEIANVIPQTSANGKIVIVLDPGHDDLHCGAAGNGLREENINLRIAQYCKAELEQYRNVTVYMTREDGSCLDTSSNGNCMKARCNYAASVNADLLVSIHVDAGSVTGTGAMVIVAKNGVYRDDLSTVTQDSGQKILNELNAIGLASRGLYIRMSDSSGAEFQYPNGAVADWYSITRNSIKAGVPGIIVEHGFISNPSDVANYLNSDEKLRKLGVADATGIAKYFNLSKGSSFAEVMGEHTDEPYTDTTENVAGFVASLYHSVLGRTPSCKEVYNWVEKVELEQLTGSALVKRFLNSEEFRSKQYSNEEYVEKLYRIYLDRDADVAGKAYWVSQLETGIARLQVADLIGNSPEFQNVCTRYGMAQSGAEMQYVKLYPKVAEFVTDYYYGLLNRAPDAGGLEYWTRRIIQGDTAADLTKNFINSPEFQNRNLGSGEFVEGVYQTYLNRASDPEGKAYWMTLLPTMSYAEKKQVIRGFIGSAEYLEHCERYGITVGKL